jgi:hypothetical protein
VIKSIKALKSNYKDSLDNNSSIKLLPEVNFSLFGNDETTNTIVGDGIITDTRLSKEAMKSILV